MTRAQAQRRRSRALVVAAFVVAAVVLVTSFPLSSLLGQRGQLASVQAQTKLLSAENRSLSTEASRLADPATVAAIVRGDFGFVEPGEKAYDILPAPGAPATAASDSGHVPLDGPPVVPGSAQSEALLDLGAGTTPVSTPVSGSRSPATGPGGSGLLDRIVHDLEFWR